MESLSAVPQPIHGSIRQRGIPVLGKRMVHEGPMEGYPTGRIWDEGNPDGGYSYLSMATDRFLPGGGAYPTEMDWSMHIFKAFL